MHAPGATPTEMCEEKGQPDSPYVLEVCGLQEIECGHTGVGALF